MDTVDQVTRSRMMGQIRGKDTKPELIVRRIAHRLGYRYRLHCPDLPGRPDLVFIGRRKVVFVHGCYWHRHEGCRYAYSPKSNVEFWAQKFENNERRDVAVLVRLRNDGWEPLIIWECECADDELVAARLGAHLGGR